MYNEKIEGLIKAALADGVLTEKEKQILFRRAQAEGIDLDEFEMVLDAKLVELQNSSKSSAPKSEKMGDVRKCPACGAIVSAGSASCKECGFAFVGIDSAKSIQKLYDDLQAINNKEYIQKEAKGIFSTLTDDDDDIYTREFQERKKRASEKATIIRNFPVPNSKNDLIEFLSGIHSQANPKGRKDSMSSIAYTAVEDLGLAYWVLYTKCISLAKVSFAKDPAFQFFFNHYEDLLWKSKSLLVRLFSKRK